MQLFECQAAPYIVPLSSPTPPAPKLCLWVHCSSSVASKDLLASDPLLSSIVVQLKTGAGRKPGSSGGVAGTGPAHGSHTLVLAGTEEPLGRERRTQAQGLAPAVQHRRSTGTGSSTSHRQLVDVGIWQVDFMDLQLIRQIGSGSFGRVRRSWVGRQRGFW